MSCLPTNYFFSLSKTLVCLLHNFQYFGSALHCNVQRLSVLYITDHFTFQYTRTLAKNTAVSGLSVILGNTRSVLIKGNLEFGLKNFLAPNLRQTYLLGLWPKWLYQL